MMLRAGGRARGGRRTTRVRRGRAVRPFATIAPSQPPRWPLTC